MGFRIGGIVAFGLSQIDQQVDHVIGLDGSFVFKDWQEISNVDYSFVEFLSSAKRIIINVPEATHGEFSDELYLFRKQELPWIRERFNTLDSA